MQKVGSPTVALNKVDVLALEKVHQATVVLKQVGLFRHVVSMLVAVEQVFSTLKHVVS
jgi:hypothetical protein